MEDIHVVKRSRLMIDLMENLCTLIYSRHMVESLWNIPVFKTSLSFIVPEIFSINVSTF